MTFKAKYHVLEALLLIGMLALGAVLSFQMLDDRTTRWIGIAMLVFLFTSPLWFYPHRYEVREGYVYVKAGILTIGKVNVHDITSIKVARVWPFCSHLIWPTEGLRLIKKKGRATVIPRDIDAFVEAVHRQQTMQAP